MTLKLNALGLSFQLEMEKQQSLLWRYAVAQAAVESRYFRSKLIKQSNNAWGIKYIGQYGALPIGFLTSEFDEDGKERKIRQDFCKWETVEGAVRAYYNLVQRHYPASWKARTPHDFYAGMKRWATDPNYFDTCMGVYRRIYGVRMLYKVTE